MPDRSSRSRSLAIGRLDGTGPVAIIKPREVGILLEALRLAAETDHEASGNGVAALRSIHDRIAHLTGVPYMETF